MSNHRATPAAADTTTDAPAVEAGARAMSWAGPLVSTLVTLPLAYFAHLIVALGASAAEDTQGASASLTIAIFMFGLLVPLTLLAVAWALAANRRDGDRLILYCFWAPVSVLLLTVAVLAFVA